MTIEAGLHRVPIAGGSVAVAACGPAGARTIVFLHGLSLDHTIWAAQAAALAPQNRVLSVDLRGHGASSAPPGPYTMDDFADDLVRVFEAFAIDRAVLTGHSLGGFVALAFARRRRDLVAGVLLVGSKLGPDSPETAAMRLDLAAQADRMTHSMIADADLNALVSRRTRSEHPDIPRSIRALIEASDPRGGAASLRAIANRSDSSDLFTNADVPLGSVVGDEDCFITVEDGTRDVRSAQLGTLDVVPACGHHAMLEVPERTTASLRRLLRVAS